MNRREEIHSENILLIFVKNADKGKVKTRLAENMGDEKALTVYRKLLDYTREVVRPLSVNKEVWYAWRVPADDEWGDENVKKELQQGDTLGERMVNAFGKAFDREYRRVVIIGSDCAQLTTALLEEAFDRLDSSDLVVGPSKDGGYYLLGMKKLHKELFEDIDWSTPRVLRQSANRARAAGLSLSVLETLNDVDTEDDWKEVKDWLK